jgi:antitoxin MazE
MVTKVRKWGNSLGVRIPKSFALDARIGEGAEVNMVLQEDRIVIRPVRRRRYRLEDLVARITPRNRHPEADWGRPVGREIL